MNKIKILFLSGLALVLAGCVSPSGSTNSIATSMPLLDPVIISSSSIATTQALVKITDPEKKKKAADDLYNLSVALNSLTGTVPTNDQVNAALAPYITSDEPEVAALVQTLAGVYSSYAKAAMTNNNVKLAAEVLGDVASGVSTAASNYK